MEQSFDVIVIGLGGMGSAAAYQLARRGAHVLGLERHTPAHNQGSSHGRSRIIRQAYFEGEAYVPLLFRAYDLWRELEQAAGEHFLTITGGLMIGNEDDITVTGALQSAQLHNIPHTMLDANELRKRYPMMQPQPSTVALYEPNAGTVLPEATVRAHVRLAAAHGAELHFEEPALSWEAGSAGVQVTTANGSYSAKKLIIAPGAWAPQLMADLGLPLTVERQLLYWFEPLSGFTAYEPERFPIFIWELENGMQFYGFPAETEEPRGVKAAFFRKGITTTPETIDRTIYQHEIDEIRAAIDYCMPDLNGRLVDAQTCMYTTTPDEHFIIATHPKHSNVVIASPCSGHGYKFASVIGEILADLALEGSTNHPIDLFNPARLVAK